jgi:hypothetical protein
LWLLLNSLINANPIQDKDDLGFRFCDVKNDFCAKLNFLVCKYNNPKQSQAL